MLYSQRVMHLVEYFTGLQWQIVLFSKRETNKHPKVRSPNVVTTEKFRRIKNCSFWNTLVCIKMSFNAANRKAISNSADTLTFDLSDRAEVLLKAIIKLGISDRLKVTCVNTARGSGVAAFAHACVVAQSTLIQVRVSQSILRWNPLWLETKNTSHMQ